jgi:hypothetical protein
LFPDKTRAGAGVDKSTAKKDRREQPEGALEKQDRRCTGVEWTNCGKDRI